MSREVIKIHDPNSKESSSRAREVPSAAQDLPPSAQKLFTDLSSSLQCQLIPQEVHPMAVLWEGPLEVEMDFLDEQARETYLSQCLFELFEQANLRHWLEVQEITDIKGEVKHWLDVFWSNRGKKEEEFFLLTDPYYQRFRQQRDPLERVLVEAKTAERELYHALGLKKSKRVVAKLRNQWLSAQRAAQGAEQKLDAFDKQYKNTLYEGIYFRDVESRRRKESAWMRGCVAVIEYLDAVEFATIMAEGLERHVFHQEYQVLDRTKYPGMHRPPRQEEIQESRKIMGDLVQAIEEWQADKGDLRYKVPLKMNDQKRKKKLVEYFQALVAAYREKQRRGVSDRDLDAETKYMEVTLTILSDPKYQQ